MFEIKIADTTLCSPAFSFKEKLGIARQLEKLHVDIIELPEIVNVKTDILLVRTISSFLKKSTLSVGAGSSRESVEYAKQALSSSKNPIVRIELPVSPVGMEYSCHKKPQKMLEWIETEVKEVVSSGIKAELCLLDATRAEKDFLEKAIKVGEDAGASAITVCDSASSLLPDDFADFALSLKNITSLPIGVKCDNRFGLGASSSVLAVKKGISIIKTGNGGPNLDSFGEIIKNLGVSYEIKAGIKYTELNRTMAQINRITDNSKSTSVSTEGEFEEITVHLDGSDSIEAVSAEIKKLGYELTGEDEENVFNEIKRLNKTIDAKELEAIIATVAQQVPATYVLENFIIMSNNMLQSSAQVSMRKNGELLHGISEGDGPIDAAFKAIEQIIGRHYVLDGFQIQAITEGRGAMGSAVVKLLDNGKLHSGTGLSTDIIESSIRAYVNAVNKIVYEEA